MKFIFPVTSTVIATNWISVMQSPLVYSKLRLITLLVMSDVIATHWMSVMTSALVQSRIRSMNLSTLGTTMSRVP